MQIARSANCNSCAQRRATVEGSARDGAGSEREKMPPTRSLSRIAGCTRSFLALSSVRGLRYAKSPDSFAGAAGTRGFASVSLSVPRPCDFFPLVRSFSSRFVTSRPRGGGGGSVFHCTAETFPASRDTNEFVEERERELESYASRRAAERCGLFSIIRKPNHITKAN